MNALQIEQFVRGFYHVKFQGVFSCDTLPPNPQLLVCNTDPHDKNSLDCHLRAVFKDYMNKHCRHWTFNRRKLQSVLSRFCGHYCCFYCVFRCIGYDMRKIVSMFTNDTAFNDVLVHTFVCR